MITSSATVLITGASGFVGQAIVDACAHAGLKARATGKRPQSPWTDIDYHCADINDPHAFEHLCHQVDWVIHSAGLAHQFRYGQFPSKIFEHINVNGIINVLLHAVQARVRHFVLISSVSVYGEHAIPSHEDTPCHPEGAYAQSKLSAEQKAIDMAESAGMPLTILRLATVYGEGDPGNVGRLLRTIDRNRFIWIGDGGNRKSLIHREDVARACLAVLAAPAMGTRIFNLSAPPCTMQEVVEGLAANLGRRLPYWHIPTPIALTASGVVSKILPISRLQTFHNTVQKWVTDDVYDATKFCETFDFQPQVSLAEGLQREVAWYRQHASA